MVKTNKTGWFYESTRHSLAAKGIPTGRKYNAGVVTLQPKYALPSWVAPKPVATVAKVASSVKTVTGTNVTGTGSMSGVKVTGGSGISNVTKAVVTPVASGPVSNVSKVLTPTAVPISTPGYAVGSNLQPLTISGQTALNNAINPQLTISQDAMNKILGVSSPTVSVGGAIAISSLDASPAVASGYSAASYNALSAAEKAATDAFYTKNLLTSGQALTAKQAAAIVKNPNTTMDQALLAANTKIATPAGAQTLQANLLLGETGSVAGVTGQAASLQIVPQIGGGVTPLAIKVMSPSVSQGYSAMDLLTSPDVPSGLGSAGFATATKAMETPKYAALAGDATMRLTPGVTRSDAADAIAYQLGITDLNTANASQLKVLGNLSDWVNGKITTPPDLLRVVDPGVQTQYVPSPQSGERGYGGDLLFMGFGPGRSRAQLLADYYRDAYGVGRDIEGGLSAGAKVAIGTAAAGGMAAYGLSQAKKMSRPAETAVAAYAARKGMKPWQVRR